jgi:hypothetical protein
MHKDNFPIKNFGFFKDCSAYNIQFLPYRNVLLPITKASLSWLKSQTIDVKEIHEGAMLQAAESLTLQYVVYIATSVLKKVATLLNDAAPRKNRSVSQYSGYVALSILPRCLGLLHSTGVRGLVHAHCHRRGPALDTRQTDRQKGAQVLWLPQRRRVEA